MEENEIWFKVGKPEDEKHMSVKDNQYVTIMRGNKEIGRIFSPSGSDQSVLNAIQVCGFSEAFDLWGCVYDGYKDIQLIYDEKKLSGYHKLSTYLGTEGCDRCFREPCACENKFKKDELSVPFKVKHHNEVENRLKYAKKDD